VICAEVILRESVVLEGREVLVDADITVCATDVLMRYEDIIIHPRIDCTFH